MAQAILPLAHAPRREVVVGLMGKLGRLEHALMPGLVEATLGRGLAAYLDHAAEAPVTDGNLHEASRGPMAVEGGWRRPWLRTGAVALGLAAAGLVAARAARS